MPLDRGSLPSLFFLPGFDPHAIAISAPGRPSLSYGDLRGQIGRTADRLREFGVGRNDRVALVLPNGPEMAAAFLGVAACAASAPLNPAYRESEFEFYLSDLRPRLLLAEAGAETPARGAAAKLGIPVAELAWTPDQPAGQFDIRGETALPPAADGFAGGHDAALVLHTSGTTAKPKLVPLTHANLRASATAIARTLALSPADRCLNVMPLFHIHGLMTALSASLASGGSVFCTPGFQAQNFFAWLREAAPTWYTAVPTMHQAIAAQASAHRDTIALCPLRFVRSSSAALPPIVLKQLEEIFSTPVIEAYGMTEASHQMASNPLPPGVRKPGTVGIAAGPEVAILDAAGNRLSAGQTGEVAIRGANVTPGYQENPAANAAAFTNGWFRTGDQGFQDADGYLTLTGRLKEIINRGGEKIAPREIDEALLDHPGVAQAVAFAISHPTLGEDVGAAVVLKPGTNATEREIRAFAAGRLADFKVPRRILILDEIPKGATGKIQRVGLAERLGLSAGTDGRDGEKPREGIEEELARIWSEVLRVPSVSRDANFFQLGGDSLTAVVVLSHVRERWGVELPTVCLFDEAATIAGMAKLIAAPPASTPGTRVGRRHTTGDARLSFAQERLWFLWRADPDAPTYNRATRIEFEGPLDLEALERGLNAVIERHEALRTVFPTVGGFPQQRILPSVPLIIQMADGEEEAVSLARQPFDLARGPLVRATVIRDGPNRNTLIFTVHHIVFDGWSMGVLARELVDAYEARRPIEPLPLQYADFACWQREQTAVYAPQVEFWKSKLAAGPRLTLPADRPRPPVPSPRGGRVPSVVPAELLERIRSLALGEGATPFMALLAAFYTLLHRYSGSTDLVVGTPVAGRDDLSLQSLIGLFVNTLALRVDLSGDPTFRELLRRVRGTALEAYANRQAPFDRVVEELDPERDPAYTPVFQTMFVLQNAPQPDLALPGLRASVSELDLRTSRFDLVLSLWEKPEGLEGWFEYSAALFDPSRIERMQGHFAALLESAAGNPDLPLSRLGLLTAGERTRLLESADGPAAPCPSRSLPELFTEQAVRTPEAPAILTADSAVAYGDLDRRSTELAQAVLAKGVRVGDVVAVCTERSPGLLVAILAVLKAGAAYLPLDPAHPVERLDFILDDSSAAAVLTTPALAERFPGRRIIDIHASGPAVELPQVSGGALAYIIYTSGSTGRPKGVAVEHRSVANLAAFVAGEFQLGPGSRVLQFSAISFDAMVWEVFPALLSGAAVFVPRADAILAGGDLAEMVEEHAITALTVPPSVLQGWNAIPALRSLRTLAAAGEPCPAEVAARWSRGRDFYNAYGPTETTVCATIHRATGAEAGVVPIGRPIANLRAYVLDERLAPVPVGIPGELYIAGIGVARGYLGRPEESAARFLADPWRPGERMYRTGDLARRREDGSLEFLGRADRQIKIRGFRIEPEEIEAALLRHPAVDEAAVVARTDSAGEKRLVAYAVGNGLIPGSGQLRDFLSERLPAYMVPSLFVPLDRMPHTPSGKVDRARLPEPPIVPPAPASPLTAANPQIQGLAQLWKHVLGVEPASLSDNFFELGGHSLLVARVLDQVEQVYGRKIPLAALLAEPTLASLDRALTQAEAADSLPSIWQIQTAGALPPLYFVHGDFFLGGFYCLDLSRQIGDDVPFHALPQHGLDGGAVPGTIEEMAAEHVATLRAFQPQGPYLLSGMCNGGLIAVEMARQLMASGETVDLVAPIAAAPFNGRLIGLDYQAGREEVTEAYRRAMVAYRPAPLNARITLIWPEEEPRPIEVPDDPAMGWSRVAPQVEVLTIPGNHSTCMLEYMPQTAAALRSLVRGRVRALSQ